VRADPFDVGLLNVISTGTSRRSTPERPGSSTDGDARSEQMTSYSKQIPHEAVDDHEALRLPDGLEPSHLALALTVG
jgi:hypothetical protein